MTLHSLRLPLAIGLVFLCIFAVIVLRVTASETDDDLPFVRISEANNLQQSARLAASDCKPLLLEFSASDCPYCSLLEEEIIKPILRNRDYDSKVLIEKIRLDSHLKLTDFNGSPVDSQTLAKRYQIQVTPTLLFLDATGVEIAERMVGVNSLDYYAGYLDDNIGSAHTALEQQNHCRE